MEQAGSQTGGEKDQGPRLPQPEELPLSEDVNNISVWLEMTLAEAVENK